MTTIFYLPLEPVKSRYTQQLCEQWMPDSFNRAIRMYQNVTLVTLVPDVQIPTDITVGVVLDAAGRSKFALAQCSMLVDQIASGIVKNNDVIYLQDFYTPGFDSVLYTASVYGIALRVFAMCHAQSVDPHDFTYHFAYWMRGYERMLNDYMIINNGGIFVASTLHKNMLVREKLCALTHVVSLPFDYRQAQKVINWRDIQKTTTVVYSSRMDSEKNPRFMLDVARRFVALNSGWKWIITTSADKVRSNDPKILEELSRTLADNPDTIELREGLSKAQYYKLLAEASIQFNCSDQDFVSWTLLEAVAMQCTPVYPNHASFLECVPTNLRYDPRNVTKAADLLCKVASSEVRITNKQRESILERSNLGRLLIPHLILNGQNFSEPVNVWDNSVINDTLITLLK